MGCQQTIRDLVDYLDGALDAELVRLLEKHLADCEDCRIVVDTTRKTVELYCNSEPLPLPADVSARLQRALAERLQRDSS